MKKKLLAVLLALSMALTLLPATALADGETGGAGEVQQPGDEISGGEDTGDTDDTENPDNTGGTDDTESPDDTGDADDTENPDDTGDADDTENPDDTGDADDTEDPDDTGDAGDTENPDDTENTGETVTVAFPVVENGNYEALVESIPESLISAGGTVSIPASAGETDVSYITITLSAAAVEALYNKGNPSAAAIETDMGTVRLSGEAVSSLRRQLPGVDRVELTLSWNADIVRMARGLVSNAEAFDVEVLGMELSDLTDPILLTFSTQLASPAAFCAKRDGTYASLAGVAGSGVIHFEADSLGTFVIAPKDEADKLVPEEKPDETPDEKPDEKPEEPLPFTDVAETAWYYNEVKYAYEKDMMRGDGSETIFNPNGTTTRAMIVTILYRLEGEPAAGVSMFDDVKTGSWYADAVSWAAAHGIVNGRSTKEFAPGDPITRQELAAILYRYAGSFKGYDVTARADISSYPDSGRVSDYATEAMRWANAEGLLTGSNGQLLPRDSAIRAQAAAILMRFCENVGK